VNDLVAFALRELGSLQALVLNAGIYGPWGRPNPWDLAEWRRAMDIIFTAYCSRAAQSFPISKKRLASTKMRWRMPGHFHPIHPAELRPFGANDGGIRALHCISDLVRQPHTGEFGGQLFHRRIKGANARARRQKVPAQFHCGAAAEGVCVDGISQPSTAMVLPRKSPRRDSAAANIQPRCRSLLCLTRNDRNFFIFRSRQFGEGDDIARECAAGKRPPGRDSLGPMRGSLFKPTETSSHPRQRAHIIAPPR